MAGLVPAIYVLPVVNCRVGKGAAVPTFSCATKMVGTLRFAPPYDWIFPANFFIAGLIDAAASS
jgi:hypothetical protein